METSPLDRGFSARGLAHHTDASGAWPSFNVLAALSRMLRGGVRDADDRAAVGRGSVETDAESGGRAVGMNFSVIGDELVGGVLRGDAALEREATGISD